MKGFTHETILVLNIASITNQSFHEKSIHSFALFFFHLATAKKTLQTKSLRIK
jgi:hypothetical protein